MTSVEPLSAEHTHYLVVHLYTRVQWVQDLCKKNDKHVLVNQAAAFFCTLSSTGRMHHGNPGSIPDEFAWESSFPTSHPLNKGAKELDWLLAFGYSLLDTAQVSGHRVRAAVNFIEGAIE